MWNYPAVDDEAWEDVEFWRKLDNLDDEFADKLDPRICNKCGNRKRALNTGLRVNIFSCAKCDK